MTTRRNFLKGGAAAAATGIVFCSCGMLQSAHAQQVSRQKLPVVVGGKRVRVDLNQVGMWFADPAGDDFCLGAGQGPVTPFDGDDEAGVQAFNSLGFAGLPAP